ncbi:ribbon-helix-helix protein, CopG family [Saccharolobus islandicus]|uniref:CopG DNA-binding domain protein n=1 Tax=Saccharolobus islandicus (strain M.16.4 / Kamchatka \|nr:ribbon-helix-helix protein, CopG family [Sulfolobus islandicus]ACR41949.1 CopG DNA-binding domain protein [Sulfolobus islandicus M.16.4]
MSVQYAKNRKELHIVLREDDIKILNEIADTLDVSASDVIKFAIREYYKKIKEK